MPHRMLNNRLEFACVFFLVALGEPYLWNAGAYGGEVSEVIHEVTIFDSFRRGKRIKKLKTLISAIATVR